MIFPCSVLRREEVGDEEEQTELELHSYLQQ